MSRNIYRITCIYLILQLIIINFVAAQSEVRVPHRSLKVKREGFLDAYQNLMDGDKWAKRGKGAIPKALEYYLKVYEYNKDCPELNYKIALCYLRSDKKSKSLDFLNAAYQKKPLVAKDILYLLGRAYQFNLDFDKAIEQYNAFYNSLKNRDKRRLSEMVNKNIEECKSGKELLSKPKRTAIKNIGESINSIYDDYNALLLGGDSVMFFTSRRPARKKERPDRVNYMFDEDIYIAHCKAGDWQNAEYLEDGDLNTKHNEAIVWTSEDGKTRYLYDGFRKNGDILVTTYIKGKWKHPRKMKGKLNTSSSETSMSITKDGNTIYYVSNDSKDNLGGKDIYYSFRKQNGKWGKPQNVGSVINTMYDEESVYVKPDGKVMFFSSKGHNSMGGYDIFRSEKDGGGNWTKPENIGYPVNTPDDELFYRPSNNEKVAYFSAKRPDTKGNYDIYKVIYLGSEKKMMLSSEEQLIAYFDKPITEIFNRVSEEVKIDSAISMQGFITDIKRSTPIMAKLDLIDIERSQVVATTMSDASGAYRVPLPEWKKYGVQINAKDYMFFLDVITLPQKIQGREINRNFALTKLEVGAKIILKNIYFETGKAILTKASNTELDKLVVFLQENTDLKVEISGHTDNVGTLAYNTKLSEARAKAVVTYLVNHGIPQEQLVYKGYAFTQPMAPNTTAAGRKLNRRVEFKILSKE